MIGEWKRGRRRRERRAMHEEEEEIKKGPWKAEEDEVLLCHVSKYGPRDWSSIRSKGLLQRTGKSCRLRWVNKLRPNLKNGMKFSAEEERIVIELQGEFGNRWARIATHLPGRTDNDVKNFWSSRQKRLAKLLQNPPSTPPPLPKSAHQNRNRNRNQKVPLLPRGDGLILSEVPMQSSSAEEESSSFLVDNSHLIPILPLPDCVPNHKPTSCEANLFQFEFNPVEKNPTHESELQLPFPSIPDLLPDFQPKEEFETIPNLFDVFENVEASSYGGEDDKAQLPFAPFCFGEEEYCPKVFGRENESPDVIFDELPLDMFDQIEPLQIPHCLGNI